MLHKLSLSVEHCLYYHLSVLKEKTTVCGDIKKNALAPGFIFVSMRDYVPSAYLLLIFIYMSS